MWHFYSNSWICLLIWPFSRMEHWKIGPLGNNTPRVRSMECLTWQCKGIPAGELKISSYYSMTLSICWCCAEEPSLEVVATIFFLPWGWIIRKTNFMVREMILLHLFAVIKEMEIGGATSGILYNLLAEVIITEWGLDSYRTCHFHKYGFPNNTSKTSRGAISHNTSSVKGLML